MIFSLDVRRARKGDCLLLHFGSKANPGLVMIDGGPRNVYKPHLRPRLQEIRKARQLADNKSLPVDLLMISHVDDDHIQGIIELTNEELERRAGRQTRMLSIRSFWHNSFEGIIDNVPEKITASLTRQFGEAAIGGDAHLDEQKKDEIADRFTDDEQEMVESNLKVLASIAQGFRLRENANALEYETNPEVDGALIMAREDGEVLDIAGKLNLTVVGPMPKELEKLRQRHVAWLKELEKQGKTAADTLAAYVDPSVPNLSSIVVRVECEGRTMLLTGDARGDKILEGLVLVGLLGKAKTSKMKVDLLKVPHHGSSNNLETDFFKRVIARHYVFSGDGEHGNPERESLEMLLAARGAGEDYQVHLTYPVKDIDIERKKDWDKERAKELKKKTKKKDVRPVWSPAEHSIAGLLKKNPGFAEKVRFIESDDAAHVIDLGEPLGKAFPGLA